MSAIREMLLKNIDQEIELIFIKQKQYHLDSFVRGYPTYKDIWTPRVGDENFCLKSESENQHDKFAVAILLEEKVVGHVPINLSKIFHQFLKIPNCTIGCKVTGKRVNRVAGYGLEIPVQYIFVGAEKVVEWAEKQIKKVFENVNKKVIKCVKLMNNFLSSFYFYNVRFVGSVYSEKFHLVQKKFSALLSVRFMTVRFIETFL